MKDIFSFPQPVRSANHLGILLAGFLAVHGTFGQVVQETPIAVPLHFFTIINPVFNCPEQRLAIYVGVNGGKPRPYLFDTGSAIFEAVVGNGPYDPSKPVPGITPISDVTTNVTNGPNAYPDFGYNYPSGLGFSGTLVHATVSLYANLTDTQPLVTFQSTGSNGPIVNAIAHFYTDTTNDDSSYYWKTIATNGFPIDSNTVGTFGAASFVWNISVQFSNNVTTNILANGLAYGSVIGQVTKTGYIVDVTSSSNPMLIIGLNDQLISQFTNTIPAIVSSNPAVTHFPGSGTPSFNVHEITLQETIAGTNNTATPGSSQSVTLSNVDAILDTGTGDFNTYITNNYNSNALIFEDTSTNAISENNTFSAIAVSNPDLSLFSITTATNNYTDLVGTIGYDYIVGIGFFLQNSVMYDLQDGVLGFLKTHPLNPPTPPAYDHIVVAMLENHSYDEVAGATLPFINGVLRAGGADMTQSYSLQYPSQGNYYWLFSGSNQGIASDTPPTTPFTNSANLCTELARVGKTFGGYLDAYPGAQNLYAGEVANNGIVYATKHVPWIGFSNVSAKVTHDFREFGTNATGFAKLPAVSFVIPGLEHDMHDYATWEEVTNVTTSGIAMTNADIWLSGALGNYAQWALTHNSLLILTTDEDSTADWPTPPYTNVNYGGSNPVALTAPTASFSETATNTNGGAQTGPNQITTLFYGAHVVRGSYPEGNGITHVNVLRTIEWLCGISSGAGAQSAAVTNIGEAPVTDIFAGYVGADNFTRTTPDYSQWQVNAYQSSSNVVLQQSNGVHFLVPTMGTNDQAEWDWKVNAPATVDWSVSLGVTNRASSTISNAFAGIGLSVRNSADPENYGFGLQLLYDQSAGGLRWQEDLDQGTNTLFYATNSSVSKGAILLTYSATNQTVTAAYDVSPGGSKPKWVSLGTATLAQLNMPQTNSEADSFLVTISGDASEMNLGMNSGVAAGNFKITNGATAVTAPHPAPQTITFPPIGMGTVTYTPVPFKIKPPTASSKLPVIVTVQSGPATISGNKITLTGTGSVVLLATQAGNDQYSAAQQTAFFTVSPSNP